ncbi:PIR Superfamily Protein [Plasmodium ovale wallikeri]|uniref:PIR Superfamily Protein n=1 Tax=Plasmodium ovale wallikeri TaxID=864142 RepID=A0A1A8ZK68_PLAOA|nr:PIR Superfamily Protein [Plasmodium ovale wallikeri]SBT44460.1 PIR Superfamily Protein [Plasmodium ovale wallikeri]
MFIKDEDQIPYKFYKRLEEPGDISKLKDLSSYATISPFVSHTETNVILAKLKKNIELIRSEYFDNYKKRCTDLNFWLDKELRNYDLLPKKDSISSSITSIFNDIQWGKTYNDRICTRTERKYYPEKSSLMKNLGDFCENRENLRCNILKNVNECLEYNNYIDKKKNHFLSEKKNLCEIDGCRINDTCTLSNVDITFPKINCHALYNMEKLEHRENVITKYSSLEIGFFVFVSFLGMYVLYIFLHKFTPFESWIRTLLSKRKTVRNFMQKRDTHDPFPYSSDSEPMQSKNRIYYIDYDHSLN